MAACDCLAVDDILALFTDEVAAHDGRVADVYSDASRLLARAVLPRVEEVRPGDGLQGGVALKARDGQVALHPYVFRQVCKNGAIIAHGIHAERRIELEEHDRVASEFLVREATAACCAPEVFSESMTRIEHAANIEAGYGLNLLPLLSRVSRPMAARLVAQIMDRFLATSDRTRFGLMNAVTSLARDTRDPDLRWNLEEFGGAIPTLPAPSPSPRPATVCVFASTP
jgi:hypothetical protein